MCVPNFLLVTAISGIFSMDILECISNILPSKISSLYPRRKIPPVILQYMDDISSTYPQMDPDS